MLVTPPIATGILAIPTATDSTPPPPPDAQLPPSPSPLDDDSDDDSDDEEPIQSNSPQPPAPNPTKVSGNLVSTSLSLAPLPKPTSSTTSATLSTSSSSSSSTTSETTRTKESNPTASATTRSSQAPIPSSLANSDDNEPTSTSTSSSFSTSSSPSLPSTSTSDPFSDATALPIGQPDSGHETTVGSSPLSTAGVILAAVFGFIALVTTIYLLYRLRRRRQKQNLSDAEKQNPYASTAQETGVIFGRRGSGTRILSIVRGGQNDGHSRGIRRSRFSFLNRTWHSTGTQSSTPQQHQQPSISQTDTNTTEQWPSPLFFTLGQNRSQGQGQGQGPTTLSPSHTNPNNPPETPQTVTTITRLTTDIRRNISTTSQSGSGHARAYAHHNFHLSNSNPINSPNSFSLFNAARSTISSMSSRWTRLRLGNRSSNSRVSNGTFGSGYRDGDTTESIDSPVSEVSGLYREAGRHSHSSTPRLSPPPPPRKARGSSSLASASASNGSTMKTKSSSPSLRQIALELEIEESSQSQRQITSHAHIHSSTPTATTNTTSPTSHTRRRTGTSDLPRLPIPVAVSRGSWGSKIDV